MVLGHADNSISTGLCGKRTNVTTLLEHAIGKLDYSTTLGRVPASALLGSSHTATTYVVLRGIEQAGKGENK